MACLEEYIYESGMARHINLFTETTKKLCNYMPANYKLGVDIVRALRQLRELTITMPEAPTRTTNAAGNYMPLTVAKEHIFKQKINAEYTPEQDIK